MVGDRVVPRGVVEEISSGYIASMSDRLVERIAGWNSVEMLGELFRSVEAYKKKKPVEEPTETPPEAPGPLGEEDVGMGEAGERYGDVSHFLMIMLGNVLGVDALNRMDADPEASKALEKSERELIYLFQKNIPRAFADSINRVYGFNLFYLQRKGADGKWESLEKMEKKGEAPQFSKETEKKSLINGFIKELESDPDKKKKGKEDKSKVEGEPETDMGHEDVIDQLKSATPGDVKGKVTDERVIMTLKMPKGVSEYRIVYMPGNIFSPGEVSFTIRDKAARMREEAHKLTAYYWEHEDEFIKILGRVVAPTEVKGRYKTQEKMPVAQTYFIPKKKSGTQFKEEEEGVEGDTERRRRDIDWEAYDILEKKWKSQEPISYKVQKKTVNMVGKEQVVVGMSEIGDQPFVMDVPDGIGDLRGEGHITVESIDPRRGALVKFVEAAKEFEDSYFEGAKKTGMTGPEVKDLLNRLSWGYVHHLGTMKPEELFQEFTGQIAVGKDRDYGSIDRRAKEKQKELRSKHGLEEPSGVEKYFEDTKQREEELTRQHKELGLSRGVTDVQRRQDTLGHLSKGIEQVARFFPDRPFFNMADIYTFSVGKLFRTKPMIRWFLRMMADEALKTLEGEPIDWDKFVRGVLTERLDVFDNVQEFARVFGAQGIKGFYEALKLIKDAKVLGAAGKKQLQEELEQYQQGKMKLDQKDYTEIRQYMAEWSTSNAAAMELIETKKDIITKIQTLRAAGDSFMERLFRLKHLVPPEQQTAHYDMFEEMSMQAPVQKIKQALAKNDHSGLADVIGRPLYSRLHREGRIPETLPVSEAFMDMIVDEWTKQQLIERAHEHEVVAPQITRTEPSPEGEPSPRPSTMMTSPEPMKRGRGRPRKVPVMRMASDLMGMIGYISEHGWMEHDGELVEQVMGRLSKRMGIL